MVTNTLFKELQDCGYYDSRGISFILDSLKDNLIKNGYDCFKMIHEDTYKLAAWSSKDKRKLLRAKDKNEYYAIIKFFIKLLRKNKIKQ